jgi:thiamine biosynthesis lipoprotein
MADETKPPRSPEDTRFQAGRRRFLGLAALLSGGAALAVVRPILGGGAPVAAALGEAKSPRSRRLESSRPALGTWMRVVVCDHDPRRAERAAEGAFRAVRLVDAQMSIHRPESQVSRVNALAGRSSAPVDGAVLDVVERAVAMARRTNGLYDPTVLPLMRLYGFYHSGRSRWPTDREIAATLDRTGYHHIRVDRGAGRIGLARDGVALDLGSIGKGWALDRAVDAIRAEGVSSALVDLGGNIYALGAPDDDAAGWSVGIPHPETGRIERVLTLRDRAIATSNDREQNHLLGRLRVGHHLDARRGRPEGGHQSATVVAKTGLASDVHSTVAYLLGPSRFHGFPEILDTCFLG